MPPVADPPPRTGNYGPLVPATPPSGGITPIPLVLVVDANTTATSPDGAWSGDRTFPTLQAAYDALQANAPNTPATIWLAPAGVSVGPLAMATDDSRALSLRGHGNQYSVTALIDSILISNACSGFELRDVVVTKDVVEEGGEGTYSGFTVFDRTTIEGNVTLPGCTIYTQNDSGINGPIVNVGAWIAHDLAFGPPTLILAFSAMSCDANSEQALFRGALTAITATAELLREDNWPSASAVMGPDADHTFPVDRRAVILVAANLTANRVYTLADPLLARGFVVDVYRQGFDLDVKDSAATTLYTYAAGAEAVRLFFFSATGGVYVLSDVEQLEQS